MRHDATSRDKANRIRRKRRLRERSVASASREADEVAAWEALKARYLRPQPRRRVVGFPDRGA